MKFIVAIITVFLLLQSCKTKRVYIKTVNPAPVTITSEIKKIGIVNRSIPDTGNVALNTVHQKVNVQTLQLIKDASTECIRGLKNELGNDSRFVEIKILDTVRFRTPVAGAFPSPLPWEEINRICLQNQVDLIYSLDIFDTQLKIVPRRAPIGNQPINPVDIIGNVATQQVNISTTVKTGWRMYDPNQRLILDEFGDADVLTFTASLFNITNTVEALLGRKEAIKQDANRLGHRYALRILPYRFNVSRDYYVKGNQNFKIAKHKIRTGNWDAAATIWLNEANNSKRKLASRACCNMALISEMNGDVDGAIQWCQKSYETRRNKLALRYLKILQNRKTALAKLKFQEEQKN